MAGSPEYLALLDSYQSPLVQRSTRADAWTRLRDSWDWFAMAQSDKTLNRLAHSTLEVLEWEHATRPILLQEAAQLHVAKNAGYAGHSQDPWYNFRLAQSFNVTPAQGVFIRMSDKWSRITSLQSNPDNDQVGESILETLRDLFAYALIAICLLNEAIDYV